jgi:hydrogenase-4 component B
MMQLPQVLLAFLCVLLGVVPAIGFRLMQHALDASRGGLGTTLANAWPMTSGPLLGLAELHSAALFAPLALAAVLMLMFALAYGISRIGNASRRAAVPWLCGYVSEADCHRYVAHNFYGEIKRYFRWMGGGPRPQPAQPAAWKEH